MLAPKFSIINPPPIPPIAPPTHKDHHARGQSLYNSIAYGVGGAIGGIGGGLMIENFGASLTFTFSAILPLCGFVIIFLGLRDFPRNI